MCTNTHTYMDTDTDMCMTMSMINCTYRGVPLTEAIHKYDSDMSQNEPFSSHLLLGPNACSLDTTMKFTRRRHCRKANVAVQLLQRSFAKIAAQLPFSLLACCWGGV